MPNPTVRSSSAYGNGGGSQTQHVVSVPAGTIDTDYCLVFAHVGAGGLTLTPPAGFASIYAGSNGRCQVFGKFAAGEGSNWTWTLSSAYKMVIHCVTVRDTSGIDSSGGATSITTGSSNPWSSTIPSIAYSASGGLLIGGVGMSGNVTITKPASMTSLQATQSTGGSAASGACAWEALVDPGTTGTRIFTQNDSATATGWLGVFKPLLNTGRPSNNSLRRLMGRR